MSAWERRFPLALFAIVASVYSATTAGITSSNDGSHYALARAIAGGDGFVIGNYAAFTESLDFSVHDGKIYSDRPPGTGVVTALVYRAASAFPPPPVTIHSKHDAGNPRIFFATLVPVLAAAGTVTIVYSLLRRPFGLSFHTSAAAALALAFGTTIWKYGTLLYSHALSGLLVISSVALLLRGTATFRNRVLLGLLLGAGVVVEYSNALVAGWLAVFLAAGSFPLWGAPPHQGAGSAAGRAGAWSRQWIGVALGLVIPAVFLMSYNAANFGGPFEFSTFKVIHEIWPEGESFWTFFATPLWEGFPALLLYGGGNQGLFWLSPFAMLGFAGLAGLWSRSRAAFLLLVGGFALLLLLFGTKTSFNSATDDSRYLTPLLALWFVPVAFGVEAVWGASSTESKGWPWRSAIVYALLFLSVRNQLMLIAFSWGHDLVPASLAPRSVGPGNVLAVGRAVAPNAPNVLFFWALLAVAGAGAWLFRRANGAIRRRSVPESAARP